MVYKGEIGQNEAKASKWLIDATSGGQKVKPKKKKKTKKEEKIALSAKISGHIEGLKEVEKFSLQVKSLPALVYIAEDGNASYLGLDKKDDEGKVTKWLEERL